MRATDDAAMRAKPIAEMTRVHTPTRRADPLGFERFCLRGFLYLICLYNLFRFAVVVGDASSFNEPPLRMAQSIIFAICLVGLACSARKPSE